MKVPAVLLLSLVASGAAFAAGPYAGQERRAVTTVSAQDIEDLRAGRGWGLAKPAELNGFPGPRHVLDLAANLGLDAAQKARIEQIFLRMQRAARKTGSAYVTAERALDAAFRSGAINEALLSELVAKTERLRAELRRIHLQAHLETAPLLTEHQRHLYAELRGYGASGGHGTHQH